MRTSTRFTRSCPTCGRLIDIPVEQIGRMVMCAHCHAEFAATATCDAARESIDKSLDFRIDRLLAETGSTLARHHFAPARPVESRTYEV